MVVNKNAFLSGASRGTSMTEVILSMAVIAIVVPFLYSRISDTTNAVRDVAIAREVIALRDVVLNYVRANQDKWPDVAQIKLSDDELTQISDGASAGFIDKYVVRGATITDVYLAFNVGRDNLDSARIARNIGTDAAVVGNDGIAYGTSWAVSAPEFQPGQLIYRVTRNTDGMDTSKYLHRASFGDDELNVMQRDLNMGGNDMYDVGGVVAKSGRVRNVTAVFASADTIDATNVYFSHGANVDGAGVQIGNMRVTGDVTGFRNINANTMNGTSYTTQGRIITDRATVKKSVNVARDLTLKSTTSRTISGFTGVTANSVKTPYISTEEIIFYEDYGLTLSGELLMSTTAPLKLGAWTFPSTTPPRFNSLTLDRAGIPTGATMGEFDAIMHSGWKSVPQKDTIQ